MLLRFHSVYGAGIAGACLPAVTKFRLQKKDCGGGGAAGNGTCFVQQVFSEGTRLTLHTSGPCQSLLNAFFAARTGRMQPCGIHNAHIDILMMPFRKRDLDDMLERLGCCTRRGRCDCRSRGLAKAFSPLNSRGNSRAKHTYRTWNLVTQSKNQLTSDRFEEEPSRQAQKQGDTPSTKHRC